LWLWDSEQDLSGAAGVKCLVHGSQLGFKQLRIFGKPGTQHGFRVSGGIVCPGNINP